MGSRISRILETFNSTSDEEDNVFYSTLNTVLGDDRQRWTKDRQKLIDDIMNGRSSKGTDAEDTIDVERITIEAFSESSVAVWGGDVSVDEWPETIPEDYRNWCRQFAAAVMKRHTTRPVSVTPDPHPASTGAAKAGFSLDDISRLCEVKALINETKGRIYSPFMSDELRNLHKRFTEAEAWLDELLKRPLGTK